MDRRIEKLTKFVRFCDDLAALSNCKARQCGAIVFDSKFTEIKSIGYNGPARGSRNDGCKHDPSVVKDEYDRCGCAHAEANSLLRLRDGDGLIMYSTTMPCKHCASLIANCGRLKIVLWRWPYKNTNGVDVLLNAGVRLHNVDSTLQMPGWFLLDLEMERLNV